MIRGGGSDGRRWRVEMGGGEGGREGGRKEGSGGGRTASSVVEEGGTSYKDKAPHLRVAFSLSLSFSFSPSAAQAQDTCTKNKAYLLASRLD